MAQDQQLALLKVKSIGCEELKCSCSKSKCLKMYCECFTEGRFCDESCNCLGCANLPGNEDLILKTRKAIRTRNPLAFKPKVSKEDAQKSIGDPAAGADNKRIIIP